MLKYTSVPFDGAISTIVSDNKNPLFSILDKVNTYLLFKSGIVVDVGAYLGWFGMEVAQNCEQVLCFEPSTLISDLLTKNIKINELDNIKVYTFALSDKEGTAMLTAVGDRYNSQLSIENVVREEVKIITLDSLNLSEISLLKISTNSHELEIAKGSVMSLFKSNFPPIIVRVNRFVDQTPLIKFLRGLGYQSKNLIENGEWLEFSGHKLYLPLDRLSTKKLLDGEKYLEKGKEFSNARNYKLALQFGERAIEANVVRLHETHVLMATCHWYLNDYEESMRYCDMAIFSSERQNKADAFEVLRYLVKPIKTEKIKLDFSGCDIPSGYFPSSSSIIKTETGYVFNIRCVSYKIKDDGSYILDKENKIQTKNVLVRLDENLEFVSSTVISDPTSTTTYYIKGMEDLRLISETTFFCTRMDMKVKREGMTAQMCKGEMKDGVVTKCEVMEYTDANCEKNWLPFTAENPDHPFRMDGLPHHIYNYDPITIYQGNKIVKEIATSQYFGTLRGSAPPIPFEKGYLMIVHQVYETSPRIYFHRFLYLDEFWDAKISRAWTFENQPIEYTLSSVIKGDHLLIPYSTWDRSSKICRVLLADIREMLNMKNVEEH